MRVATLTALLTTLVTVHAGYFSLSTKDGVELAPGHIGVDKGSTSGQYWPAAVPIATGPFTVRKGRGGLIAECDIRGTPGTDKYYNYHVEFGYDADRQTLTMSKCGCDGQDDNKGVIVCEYVHGRSSGRLDCVGENSHDPKC